jgi:hypothetical protein
MVHEISELVLQSTLVPQERSVQAFAAKGTDDSFDERMR